MKKLFNGLLAVSDARFLQFYVPYILVALGVLSVMLEVIISGSTEGLWLNLGTELAGAAMTYVLLTLLIRPAEEQEEAEREAEELKQELIRKMGSNIRDVAVPAVEDLRAHGWLKDGSLERARLWGANLQGADLWGTDLHGAELPDANLQGAKLWRAKLQEVILNDANLQEAELLGINLQEAELRWTDLQGADLGWADLQWADLEGANLQGANLGGANLQGAYLEEAVFDDKTTLPDGTQWAPDTDMARFTDPAHPDFWRSDKHWSPAYRGRTEEPPEA